MAVLPWSSEMTLTYLVVGLMVVAVVVVGVGVVAEVVSYFGR